MTHEPRATSVLPAGFLRQKGRNAPIKQLNAARFLPFVPKNELGVVYVFALIAKELGFEVEVVRARFPDCGARWQGRKVRIEFEFRSINFKVHGHDADECDLVVCWKHDWPGMPAGLAPIELRKLFGLDRDVFVVAYHDKFWKRLPDDRDPANGLWSVPASAGPDDLLLIYRPQFGSHEGEVTDLFRIHTPPERVKRPRWRDDPDWMADIQRVARLRKPISFSRLRELGAHGGLENRPRKTEYWPKLYRELTERARPSHSLRRYEIL